MAKSRKTQYRWAINTATNQRFFKYLSFRRGAKSPQGQLIGIGRGGFGGVEDGAGGAQQEAGVAGDIDRARVDRLGQIPSSGTGGTASVDQAHVLARL
jgi:hypothetical protein